VSRRPETTCRTLVALGALVVATSGSLFTEGFARADTTTTAAADGLFRAAKKAMEAGDYAKACPLFEESQRLDPAGGTLLNWALCLEKAGKLASAVSTFELAAERARIDRRTERDEEARAHVAALRPRVPLLTLTFAQGAPTKSEETYQVWLDGKELPASAIGVALALDPGPHSLRLDRGAPHAPSTSAGPTDPRPTPVELRVDLREGESRTLVLDRPDGAEHLPPAAPTTAVPEPPKPSPRPPTLDASPTAAEHTAAPTLDVGARPEASFSTASWISFGVAGVGLGTAAVSGLLAVSARADYTSKCFDDRGYCTDTDARAAGDRARGLAWVSTVSLGVGVVALWTGLLLPRSFPVRLAQGAAGPASIGIRGSF
jgi:hypothetical protein